jgi:hypothetical protein
MNVTILPWNIEYDADVGPVISLVEAGVAHARLMREGNVVEARELVRAHVEYIRKATWLYEGLTMAVRRSRQSLMRHTDYGNVLDQRETREAIDLCNNALESVDSDDSDDCPMCGFKNLEVYCSYGARKLHPECYMELCRIEDEIALDRAEAEHDRALEVKG